MTKLIYLGANNKAPVFKYAKQYNDVDLQFLYAEELNQKEITSFLLDDNEKYDVIIINILEINLTNEQLASLAEDILSELSNVKLCIYCPKHSINDDILKPYLETGVQFFFLYTKEKNQKHTFSQLITQDIKSNIDEMYKFEEKKKAFLNRKKEEQKQQEALQDNKKNDNNEKLKELETNNNVVIGSNSDSSCTKNIYSSSIHPIEVAVGGSTNRVGTTFLSMHFCFILACALNKKVCYIESDKNSNYINFLLKYSDEKEIINDKEHHKLTLKKSTLEYSESEEITTKTINIDCYYNVNMDIYDYIHSNSYDYMIYDFGNLNNNNKKIKTFKTFYNKILCGSPVELEKMINVIKQINNNKMTCIFNLSDRTGKQQIKKMMNEYNLNSYFIHCCNNGEFGLYRHTVQTLAKILDL